MIQKKEGVKRVFTTSFSETNQKEQAIAQELWERCQNEQHTMFFLPIAFSKRTSKMHSSKPINLTDVTNQQALI